MNGMTPRLFQCAVAGALIAAGVGVGSFSQWWIR